MHKCPHHRRLGRALRAYRIHKCLTQDALAKRIGISRGFVSDIERGASEVSLQTLSRICQVTDIDPRQVLGLRVRGGFSRE